MPGCLDHIYWLVFWVFFQSEVDLRWIVNYTKTEKPETGVLFHVLQGLGIIALGQDVNNKNVNNP